MEPGFRNLGFRAFPWFRALNVGNQIWFYIMDLPGFSALPGYKAPFHGNGQSALNPGTTVPKYRLVVWCTHYYFGARLTTTQPCSKTRQYMVAAVWMKKLLKQKKRIIICWNMYDEVSMREFWGPQFFLLICSSVAYEKTHCDSSWGDNCVSHISLLV